MDLAVTTARIFTILLLITTTATEKPTDWGVLHKPSAQTERRLAKDWALSICVGAIAGPGRLRVDTNNTASALMEKGSLGVESYHRLMALADRFVARHYSGSIPGTFNMLKCIDMYHSAELDRLVAAEVRKNQARHQ